MIVFLLSVCVAASAFTLYYVGESLQWDASWSVGGISAPMHIVGLLLSVVLYVRLLRRTRIGVNDAYGMALLCVIGAALTVVCVALAAVGLYPAAAATGAALGVVACASYTIVPRGIRLVRLVFGGSMRGQTP